MAEVQQPATLLKRVKATCFTSYSVARKRAPRPCQRVCLAKREKATAPRVHSAGLESFSWREPRAESARESVCDGVCERPTTTSAVETKGDRARDRAKLVPYFSPPLCRYRVISDIGHSQSVPRPD